MKPFASAVFDFDGVLRHWDSSGTPDLEIASGLQCGAIEKCAFERTRLHNVVTGKITKRAWLAEIADDIGCDLSLIRCWAARPTHLDAALIQALRGLRRAGVEVYLASNGTDELLQELADLEILEIFTAVFNSAELGYAKPDPLFFEFMARLLGGASGVLYVDDLLENIHAAAGVGFHVYLYDSATAGSSDQLLKYLQNLFGSES